jgi:nitrogen PTS system EIIA component
MPKKIQAPADSKPDLMTASEVAECLRMCHKTVIVQAEKGNIPGKKIGSMWRFSRKAIESFV